MIEQTDWEVTTVEVAKDAQNEGFIVYWRPDRKLNLEDLDKDLAWVAQVT